VFNYNSLNTPTLDPSLIFPMACVNDLAEQKSNFSTFLAPKSEDAGMMAGERGVGSGFSYP